MTTLTATPFESAPAPIRLHACPHCGEALLAPETSEFVGAREVRHTWACDDCGHDFRTAIRIDRRMQERRLG
jgi:RNase P subunit RPR2